MPKYKNKNISYYHELSRARKKNPDSFGVRKVSKRKNLKNKLYEFWKDLLA